MRIKYKYLSIPVMFPLFWLMGFNAMAQTSSMNVEDDGFRADWFVSETGSGSALIVLGGSEGGNRFGNDWAGRLNEAGYHVLSVALFREPGLPEQLELVPVEYLDRALEWIQKNEDRRVNRIGIIGVSKGAEMALLHASENTSYDAVVAVSPSSVVWQSINETNYFGQESSWTQGGEPVEFLAYDFSEGFTGIFNLYNNALNNEENVNKARIQAENIQAPVLLLSGGSDRLWPSERMALQLKKALQSRTGDAKVYHLGIPEAGHLLLAPGLQSAESMEAEVFQFLGGSHADIVEHTQIAEQKLMEFLEKYLGE